MTWIKYPVVFALLLLLLPVTGKTTANNDDNLHSPYQHLIYTAQQKGYAKIILKLKVNNIQQLTQNSTQYKNITPGSKFPPAGLEADLSLQTAIHSTTDSLLHQLNGMDYHLNHKYDTLPYIALDASEEVLNLLPSLSDVLAIYQDHATPLPNPIPSTIPIEDTPFLSTSTQLIGADNAWSMGYTGTGWYVAVLDTGIRRTHQFFTGKTIKEACFSAESHCPNNNTSMTGTGAAAHYNSTYNGFDHGTHVAGIATGNHGSREGVAKNSNILAIQVFSHFGSSQCGGSPCVLSYDSDQIKALEYVYSQRSNYSIAAVNMSLGGGKFSAYCDNESQKAAIDNLKAVRIATVIATGNSYYCGSVSSPACISSAVAVGASDDSDTEASFNNWDAVLQEFFAPGVGISSSTGSSNSSYASWSGTSMATPHVAGAWALLRQASPNSSVDTIFNALTDTGTSIISPFCGNTPIPRINVDDAITQLSGGPDSITLTAPNGGETWTVGSSRSITWTSTGSVGNVKTEYSTNNGAGWTAITSSTPNDGSHSWTVPNDVSSSCLVKISEASDGNPSDTSNAVFSVSSSGTPVIALNRTQLNFSGIISGTSTTPQTLWVSNSGGGTLNWNITTSSSRLTSTPSSGTNSGVVTASLDTSGLGTGSYSGSIIVSDSNAANSPQIVTVNLTVINASQAQPPFGTFSTPTTGSAVSSSVPVTGWALDDVGVSSVKIYSGSNYIGDAASVEGARPDVEQSYPGYPNNYKSGWGYMLLTHFLPGGGNGSYTIYAKATDGSGNEVTLGSKTITVDNDNAVKPFGAIDSPGQGGTASGSSFVNWGWVLTPQPNSIPTDGSTLGVWVDGVKVGKPAYNVYRSDIADLFPGYANSGGAVGYFYLDTTAYENGIHAIQWTAKDSGGNSDGIGSRYFTIQNTGADAQNAYAGRTGRQTTGFRTGAPGLELDPEAAESRSEPVRVKKGFRENITFQRLQPDSNGMITVAIRELERVEIRFSPAEGGAGKMQRQTVNISPLPIGSHLDSGGNIFYWQPGAGFIGTYDFLFLTSTDSGTVKRTHVRVKIRPYSHSEVTLPGNTGPE
ncbi:MAG: S8 family serine peptidase [bacterium]|nr:S8 family serine peptidase [bacterium]